MVSRIKRKLNRPITDEHEQAALGEIRHLIHIRSQLQFVEDIESSIYATQRQMDLSLDEYIAQQREAASTHIRQVQEDRDRARKATATKHRQSTSTSPTRCLPRSKLADFKPTSTMSACASTSSKDNTDTELATTISEEDIDASISILQANICHKKRVGEIRYSNGQIMAYRPGPTTRKEIKELQKRLEGL